MDDGKCLLDVISDPQALKEFFRCTSQIALIDGDISPVKDQDVNKSQKKGTSNQSIVKHDTDGFGLGSQASTLHTSRSDLITGNLVQPQPTKPSVHFSHATTSNLNLSSSTFTSHVVSPGKNGLAVNVSSSNTQISCSAPNISGSSTLITSLTQNSPARQNALSSVHSIANLSSSKECNTTARTSLANTPLSFAFGDANKARNLLSSGPLVVSSAENSVPPSKQSVSQQLLGPSLQLNNSPKKSSPNVVSGSTLQNRTPNIKGSPLALLRPKTIAPRPLIQQNVTSGTLSEQPTAQTSVQSNLLMQGTKPKAVSPPKGQQLIAIQPKVIIAAQPNVGTGTNQPSNQTTIGITKPGQVLAGNFTIGSKLQGPLQNQVLNTLTVQQPKTGILNANVAAQSKVSSTNLVQLQPKQIAPKPEQGVGYQVTGKTKMNQEQSQLQQQLVQSLLAQTQQNQFGLQVGLGTAVSDAKKGSVTEIQRDLLQQQNQLKELLQKKQMIQRMMQAKNLQQQNTLSLGGVQVGVTTTVQNQTPAPNMTTAAKPGSQSSPLQSLINTSLTAGQGQLKLQPSVGQTNTAAATLTLANQMKNAINSKQLQQFLEKNPLLAQQLKQFNSKQTGVASSMATTTSASLPVKNVVQLQNSATAAAAVSVDQTATGTPKKLAVSLSGTQPQTLVINQAQKTDPKTLTPQKVLIVQQSNMLGSTTPATTSLAQAKVLLHTKEGRPILLTQEQFRHIQQQLASKNLSLQGKLVTATSTTTTTTTKPQVVVKPNEATTKVSQKTVSVAPKQAAQVKQDVTKGVKRPVKAVESEESKLIKRMKSAVQKDQNDVSLIDIHRPFRSHEDAVKRLMPFHVFSEPEPNSRMQKKANMLLDKLAVQLTSKSDRMINKYRQLLLGDMQRDVPSAEVVMVNRIFLAEEKLSLMKEKQAVLAASQVRVQKVEADSSNDTSSSKLHVNSPSNDQSMSLRLTGKSVPDEEVSSPVDTPESHHIDIMEDSPSPMTSATSFLTHISSNSSDVSSTQRTPNYSPDPS